MAKISVKVADINFNETIYLPMEENELREAKLVKLTYGEESLKYDFVVAGMEEKIILSEPQLPGYKPKKFYRTADDAFQGNTIPITTISLVDKLIEAGFNVITDNVVMARYKDFRLILNYISISDAKIIETCDSIDVNFRQYKTITMEGITCYQYEGGGITAFKSSEDALKAKPIKVYRF